MFIIKIISKKIFPITPNILAFLIANKDISLVVKKKNPNILKVIIKNIGVSLMIFELSNLLININGIKMPANK